MSASPSSLLRPLRLLTIESSFNLQNSHSRRLIDVFVGCWVTKYRNTQVITRDLADNPPPHLNLDGLTAISGTEDAKLNSEQKKLRQLSDDYINELHTADAIVFGVPIHNNNIPSQLKSYFDFTIRYGRTYQFIPSVGKTVGLLKDRPTFIITTGGVMHHNTDREHQAYQLKSMLNYIGIGLNPKLTFFRAQGSLGAPVLKDKSLDAAEVAIKTFVPQYTLPDDSSPKPMLPGYALKAVNTLPENGRRAVPFRTAKK